MDAWCDNNQIKQIFSAISLPSFKKSCFSSESFYSVSAYNSIKKIQKELIVSVKYSDDRWSFSVAKIPKKVNIRLN